MTDFVPCRSCKGKKGPKPGFYYTDVEYSGITSQAVVECDCHKTYVQREMLAIRANEADIWLAALDYNIDHEYKGTKSLKNVERLKKYVFEFDKFQSAMVYLYGPNGTQKTTLAHWVGANVLHKGYSVRYLLMQNLLSILTSGFDSDEAKIAKVEKLRDVDLLIVDEAFSKATVTLWKSGYQLPFLQQFLKDRVETQKKGIVFVSNTDPLSVPEEFGLALRDFVDRNTRQTKLLFEDNFIKEAPKIRLESLFD